MKINKRTLAIVAAAIAMLAPSLAAGADFRIANDLIGRQPNLKVRVNFCHRYYLKRGGDTEGKISFSMHIDQNGKVKELTITERTVGEDGLVECVSRAVSKTVYDISKETTVLLPLVFASVDNSAPELAANW